MGRFKSAWNVAIVVAIAAAVAFLPGGGRAADTISATLSVLFAAGLTYFAVQLYREHRLGLHALGDGRRALLYGTLAVARRDPGRTGTHVEFGIGEFVWFVLVLLVLYVLLALYRFARSY